MLSVIHTTFYQSVFYELRNISGTAIDLYTVSLLIGLPNTCIRNKYLRKRFNLLTFAQRKCTILVKLRWHGMILEHIPLELPGRWKNVIENKVTK